MSVVEQSPHPAGDIYISRHVLDASLFEYAVAGLRRIVGIDNTHFHGRRSARAAVSLIDGSDMRYALRRSERLRRLSANAIWEKLVGVLPATKEDAVPAEMGEIVILGGEETPHLAVTIEDPDIITEQEIMRDTVNILAGMEVFTKPGVPHVSFGWFTQSLSPRTIQRFGEYLPYALLVDAVDPGERHDDHPLEAA